MKIIIEKNHKEMHSFYSIITLMKTHILFKLCRIAINLVPLLRENPIKSLQILTITTRDPRGILEPTIEWIFDVLSVLSS